jgi:hypothetical protein
MTNFNDYVVKTIFKYIQYRDDEIERLEGLLDKYAQKCANYDQNLNDCAKYTRKACGYWSCWHCGVFFCTSCSTEKNRNMTRICVNPEEQECYRIYCCIKCYQKGDYRFHD